MSIDKRGERTWRFRVKYKRQLYTTTYEAPPNLTLKQAEKAALKQHDIFKTEVITGKINLSNNILMNQLISNVYEQYVVKLKYYTISNYKKAYNNYIIPEFGLMNVEDIRPLHIQKFVNKLSETLAPGTIKSIFNCLRKTFSLAITWQYIDKNPCEGIELPKVKKKNDELLSIENIQKLFNYYATKENSTRHKVAFYLAIGCGLRNSEIRALEVTDIDFTNNTIKIDKQAGTELTKSGEVIRKDIETKTETSNRIVYAPQFVIDAIIEHISNIDHLQTSKKLFYSNGTGGVVAIECFNRHLTKVLNKLDIPHIRFHDLRKLQATLLIQYGANVKAVSKRLGHSNVDITLNTYTATIDEIDKQLAKDFETTFIDLSTKKCPISVQ